MPDSQAEQAWTTYQRNRSALFGYARSLVGDHALAEDALHDAVLETAQTNTRKRNLKAYLFRAVRNRALHLLAKNGREVPASNGQLDGILDPKTADASAVEEDGARFVAEQLARLNQDERETIFLHLFADLKFREIASLLNAPLGTVTARYRRGLTKLAERLEESRHET